MKSTLQWAAWLLLFFSMTNAQTVETISLSDAVAIALRNNPQVPAAQKQIDAERGRFRRSISPPPPEVSLSYEYIPRGRQYTQFGEKTVAFSQSLDFPSLYYLHGAVSSTQIAVAEAEYAMTAISITAQAKTAYFQALAQQTKIKLAEENAAIAEDFARKAEIRFNVGEGTHLERLTAIVQRSLALNALEEARSDFAVAVAELYYALGRGEESREILLSDSLTYQPVNLTLEQLTAKAAAHPQIRALSAQVKVAALNRAVAWSSFLPSINASYFRQTVEDQANFYGVSAGLSFPLWAAFDQRGQVQEANAQQNIAELELLSLQNSIRLNVKTVFSQMINDGRQVELYQNDILPQAEEIYRTARASFEAGDITYIEFLQAKQTLVSARQEFVDKLAHFNISRANLEQAVGVALPE